ncbi:MAG: SbcC/MukB-like Walker B domain-containing protein, partial [Bacillota bacterium]
LGRIAGLHQESVEWEERLRVQDYVVARAQLEDRAEYRERLGQEEQAARGQMAEDEPALAEAARRRASVEQALRDLAQRRAENWAQQQIERITLKLKHARDNLARLRDDASRLRQLSEKEVQALREAEGVMRSPAFAWLAPELSSAAGEAAAWAESLVVEQASNGQANAAQSAQQAAAQPEQPAAAQPVPQAPARPVPQAPVLASRLADLAAGVRERRFRLAERRKALGDEKAVLEKNLADLANRRLAYDENTTRLRRLIAEDGGQPEPQVLCELLEIPREKWQNAVEGYLNTRRFDLIVRPEDFDRALAVYERRKNEFRLHGVGLVNTAKIMEHLHDNIAGSLAEEVQTESPFARAYVNRVLGQVMKCETEQELKRHRIAITPTCMTYQNHTARQIKQETYETPFIGERALRRQKELKQAHLAQVEAEMGALDREVRACDGLLALLSDRAHLYENMVELAQRAAGLPQAAAEVAALEEDLAAIDRTELAQIEAEMAQAEAEEKRLDELIGELRERLAANRQHLVDLAARVPAVEEEVAQYRLLLEALTSAWPAAAQRGAQRYLSERRRHSNLEIARNFEANRKTNVSHLEKVREELRQARSNYNRDYQFGGAIDASDNSAYEAERAKLEESELPSYREKIAQAREAAEQEFKEHFIHRLHEHLEVAQNAFGELNQVLREIRFGQDRYDFVVRPAEDYRKYYKMIMDEYLMEGQTLFSQAFQERYRETLDDLFRRMLDVPEAEQQKNIERLTDYRTYLEYDIRIHHGNGESTLFSKVNYEKSGGETQTPYYVAMLASFLQVYRVPHNADSARLVLFDEAFNRMDPDRVENMLAFLRSLGLQAIIAAPIDRCQLIAPHLPSTLLVMRHDRHVWVEDYTQVLELPAQSVQPAESAGFSQVAAAGDSDA